MFGLFNTGQAMRGQSPQMQQFMGQIQQRLNQVGGQAQQPSSMFNAPSDFEGQFPSGEGQMGIGMGFPSFGRGFKNAPPVSAISEGRNFQTAPAMSVFGNQQAAPTGGLDALRPRRPLQARPPQSSGFGFTGGGNGII